MATLMGSICRAATRKDTVYNILSFPTHERYQTALSKTNHNFWLYQGDGIKSWNNQYAELSNNHILLDKNLGDQQIPLDLDLDFILCQNKFGQYPVADRLSRELHLPLLCLEHTLPMTDWQNRLHMFKAMRGDVNVFISEYSREQWDWKADEAIVIHHGIDTDVFCPNEKQSKDTHVLSIVNDFANRDWCCGFNLWNRIVQGLPYKILGDTPGLSKPTNSISELVKAYRSCAVFLNTSLISPVPTVLLEAMACGCAVVSTNTCMIPSIITHGYNGLLGSNERELRQYTEELLEDKDMALALGKAARETIYTKFSMDNFISSWQNVFTLAANTLYTGERYEG
jgi:glycosyltransferase involved in cell wall biosynthesis